ncbi:hypothetical protein PM082_018159 [Marasmius tenuissimus]|nr:hypothetical protein PM082_018159 [Marasmius tenuissimus]
MPSYPTCPLTTQPPVVGPLTPCPISLGQPSSLQPYPPDPPIAQYLSTGPFDPRQARCPPTSQYPAAGASIPQFHFTGLPAAGVSLPPPYPQGLPASQLLSGTPSSLQPYPPNLPTTQHAATTGPSTS